jgi:integrase/recombinase XerC
MRLRRVRVMREGGKERAVPVDTAFFAELAAYLREERPASASVIGCSVVGPGSTTSPHINRGGHPLHLGGIPRPRPGSRIPG